MFYLLSYNDQTDQGDETEGMEREGCVQQFSAQTNNLCRFVIVCPILKYAESFKIIKNWPTPVSIRQQRLLSTLLLYRLV